MIIVDNALNKREKENNPIKVGLIGAGEMAKGMMNQIVKYTPGMVISATYNRTVSKAQAAYEYVGLKEYKLVETTAELEDAIKAGIPAITSNADALCEAEGLDILVEVTGTIEFAAKVMLKAMDHGKHILSFNAEIDATLGPILKHKADIAGVKYSVGDGDQPGVTLNLYRFVKSMGFEPLLCGNIKGLQDHYRTPETQKSFAAQWDMTPEMVTSFADGTKISFEQACIANATGMKVATRGMYGHHSKEHIDDLTHLYDIDEMKELGGIVDYVVGPKPGPGVFIYATTDDPWSAKYLKYGKLGDGPLYSFYVPYHLLFFETAISIARMIDFDDIILAPKAGPVVEVVATAKFDLKAGETIDGLGGFKSYGVCENYDTARAERLLPMGLADGCVLKKDLPQDKEITFDDVEFDPSNIKHALYKEQFELFSK
ncbi:NAD(P)H-dependent oxidoreductase [Chondrinema litorale]|uniref:NAD(P)H-dependent oxidoreductase n=1 Tax=Chondrinema litorale TaxID=2994555 RepID=UPI002542B8EA|nr:NAD(P)-dependent oxidoreductase [Chondrinema litorale]UZR92620.1 NAD(P)-dependent oxidoreductase [Chondrinema litorale]